MKQSILRVGILMVLAGLLGACAEKKDTGDKVKDAIQSTGDKVGSAADRAVDKTEDAAHKVKDKVNDATK